MLEVSRRADLKDCPEVCIVQSISFLFFFLRWRKGKTSPSSSWMGRGIMSFVRIWEDGRSGDVLGVVVSGQRMREYHCASTLRAASLWQETLKSEPGPWRALCWAPHPGRRDEPGSVRAVTGRPRSWKRRLQLPCRMSQIQSLPAWMTFSRKVRRSQTSNRFPRRLWWEKRGNRHRPAVWAVGPLFRLGPQGGSCWLA